MGTTSEKMRKLYSQWQQSGLNRKVFCQQENINYATFNYWHKQFSTDQDMGFTEIPIQHEPEFASELIFPSGARIVFHSAPSVLWLKELVG
ncbi:MAG: hypothetical protein MUF42_15535 [Cytophagaceae bacterium]|jgi:hypothetical protein|nr:hypothetical protein [Cytophagaceae bacterium]